MRQSTGKNNLLSPWVFIGGILLAGFILGCLVALILFLRPPHSSAFIGSTPVVTVIFAPTFTPVLPPPTPLASPTPGVTPGTAQPGGPIKLGIYVQIVGTDGDGLRIRSGPGTNNTTNFIGLDSEVFLVKGGPIQADNLTWWLLEAPYDKSRTGWAAGSFLGVVSGPQTTSTPTP